MGNDTSITLQKRLTPTIGESKSYTIKFENPLYHPHDGHESILSTTPFQYTKLNGVTVSAHIDDDGRGKLRIYELISGTKSYISEDAGTIDYDKGTISLKSFNPVSVTNTILKFNCIPENKDIISERNSIIVIDSSSSDSMNGTAEAYIPYGTSSTSSSVSTSGY